MLAARRTERLEALAAELVADGGEAVALALDLADPASVDACAEAAADVFGPLDVVVANAGEVASATALADDPDTSPATSTSTCSAPSAWWPASARPWWSGATATSCS